MPRSQREKSEAFVALHARPGAFVIPNPFDAGTARILEAMGFEALTTTSAGLAFTLGRRDGEGRVTRAETLAHARAIVEATSLPVAADLENGYGDGPDDVATTIREAAAVGLVGGSIEDTTGDPRRPIYDRAHAAERMVAASEAARSLPFRFVLVGRADGLRFGGDLADVIARLQAYEAAGADVLFAPGLTSTNDIRSVCASVGKPVNMVMGFLKVQGPPLSLAALAALGVKRVSVGSALSRVALGAFMQAARELHDQGTFDFTEHALPMREAQDMFAPR